MQASADVQMPEANLPTLLEMACKTYLWELYRKYFTAWLQWEKTTQNTTCVSNSMVEVTPKRESLKSWKNVHTNIRNVSQLL